MTVKTLKINDRDVSGRADESILEVAQENGIQIPTLCHLEGLSEVGACRLCLVEIKGTNRLMPACATLVQEGMEVVTDVDKSKFVAALSSVAASFEKEFGKKNLDAIRNYGN